MSDLCVWGRPMYSQVKIIAIIALISSLAAFHMYDKRSAVNKAVEAVHAEYTIKFDLVDRKAKEEKIALLEAQQKEREKKDENIRSLNSKLRDTVRMLSIRKERPKDSGEPPPVGAACTGRELFQEDGEFLIREASRADRAVIERDYYYEQYEKARLMIEGINNGR
jgi:hypothetical protein